MNHTLIVGLVQAENLNSLDCVNKNNLIDMVKLQSKITANLEKGLDLVEKAAKRGAEFIILPELFTTGYNMNLLGKLYVDLAETKTGKSIQAFQEVARKHNVYIQVGFPENRGVRGLVYNSVAVIDYNGKLIDTYAKSHLFTEERMYFAKGNTLPVYEGEFGKFAPMICYDIGFPELARIYALNGVELFTVSAAWCQADADIWENNLCARTTDNLCFAAATNAFACSDSEHLNLIGSSRVYGPRGKILAEAAWGQEDILITQIDLAAVKEARANCFYFLDRRPELYSKLAELE